MQQVVVSQNYQIEFPQDLIVEYNIRPGNRYALKLFGESIYLTNVPSIRKFRGTLKAGDFSDIRDERERVL